MPVSSVISFCSARAQRTDWFLLCSLDRFSRLDWPGAFPPPKELVRVGDHRSACDAFGQWADGGLRERVDELKAMLVESGAEPPYVLVGHSYGGLIVRPTPTPIPRMWLGWCLSARLMRTSSRLTWRSTWQGARTWAR